MTKVSNAIDKTFPVYMVVLLLGVIYGFTHMGF